MKKSLKINKARQQKALDWLAQHSNPIIRHHAARIKGGEFPKGLYLKGLDGMFPPPPDFPQEPNML